MFKYALKSLGSRKTTTCLFILGLVAALTISIASVNISSQVSQGIIRADGQYDIIIGPNGSPTELVMSTLFFSELPLGLISYKHVEELNNRGNLEYVLPFALGDSYNGHNLIGTRPEFLRNKAIQGGVNFQEPFEVVVGFNVAKRNNLKIGDKIITAHGVADHHVGSLACLFHSHDSNLPDLHDDNPYKVVGILAKTNTAYDNALFTQIESIWLAHGYEGMDYSDGHHQQVTAILIRSGNQVLAGEIMREFNDNKEYQGVNPTAVMRNLMTNIDLSKQVAFLLGAIILSLAIIIIGIMTVLMLHSIKKEVLTLRFIGIDKGSILKYVGFQNTVLVTVAVGLSCIASRGVLYVANLLASTKGIIIDWTKLYPIEVGIIVLVVFLVTVPVFLYINIVSKETLSNEE